MAKNCQENKSEILKSLRTAARDFTRIVIPCVLSEVYSTYLYENEDDVYSISHQYCRLCDIYDMERDICIGHERKQAQKADPGSERA